MEKAKEICAVVLCAFLVFSWLPIFVSALAPAPSVTLQQSCDLKSNTATVDIYVDKAEYTDAYQLSVEYDDTKLSFEKCSLENDNCNDSTSGLLLLGIFFMDLQTKSNVKIASLTFNIKYDESFSSTIDVRLDGKAYTADYARGVKLTPQSLFVDVKCQHFSTEVLPEKAATCVNSGMGECTKCTFCGYIISAGSVILPLGHLWNDGEITVTATPEQKGELKYTCTRCGETITKEYNADDSSLPTKIEKTTDADGEDFSTANVELSTHSDVTDTVEDFSTAASETFTNNAVPDGEEDSSDVDSDLYIKGDVDGDGEISVKDARIALRAAVSLESLSYRGYQAADVDGEIGVSVSDARLILRCAVGLQIL